MALGRCDHHRMFHDRLCPSFGGGNSSVQPRCPVRLPGTDLVAQRPAVPGELRTRVRFAWRGGTRTVMPRISEDLSEPHLVRAEDRDRLRGYRRVFHRSQPAVSGPSDAATASSGASLATRCVSGLGRSLSVPSDWNLTVMSGGAPLRLSRLAGAVSVWASRLSLRGTSLTREKLVQVWDTRQHHLAIRPHFGGADRLTPLYLQGFPDRKNLSKKSQKNPRTSPRTATGPTLTPRADPVRLTSSSWPQAAHRHGTSPPESPRGARP